MFDLIRFRHIQLSDVLIASSAPELGKIADDCLRDTVQMVLVDLNQVKFIDSVGLGLLVSAQTRLRRKKIKLYLTVPHQQACAMFDLANVGQIFEIFSSYDEFYATVVKNRFVLVHS
jgi:anti-anti-sigma factor